MQVSKTLAAGMLALALLACPAQSPPASQPPASQTALARHQRLAQQYLAEHNPTKAIPELRAVVALDPANVEARANLGVLLFFEGQFVQAIPQLQAAVDRQPDLFKIQALLGIAKRRSSEDAAGRADLETAFPRIEEPKLRNDVGRELIESYSASNELDRAAAVIATLLKASPADPGLLYISYRIHNQLALEALLELGLVAPDSAQTHQAMAHELTRDHDLSGTIANLRQALALDPDLPGIHFELAEALHASDDQRLRTESIAQYKLAVQTAPNDPKAATRMADIESEQGDLPAAAASYQSALKLQPGSVDAKVGLANVLTEQGDLQGAAALLEQVEAADPANVLAHFRLSVVYRKLKRPEDVKREVELYQRYKDEREKLKAVYQKMRVAAPTEEPPK